MDIGRTADYMQIMMKATKGGRQLSYNWIFVADIWFSVVNTVEEENTEEVDYCGTFKTSHKVIFLATL